MFSSWVYFAATNSKIEQKEKKRDSSHRNNPLADFNVLLSKLISMLHIVLVSHVDFGPYGIYSTQAISHWLFRISWFKITSEIILPKNQLRSHNIAIILVLPIQRHLISFLCLSSFSAFKLNFRCRYQDFFIVLLRLINSHCIQAQKICR